MSLFILLLTLMHLYHIQETHTIFIRQHEGDQNVHHKHTPILHSFNFMLSTTDVITIFDVSNKKSLIYKIIRKVCIISGLGGIDLSFWKITCVLSAFSNL